jgi:hypothetical protein
LRDACEKTAKAKGVLRDCSCGRKGEQAGPGGRLRCTATDPALPARTFTERYREKLARYRRGLAPSRPLPSAITTKRPPRVTGDIAFIPLTKGYAAVIDAADLAKVVRISWRAHVDEDGRVYAIAHKPGSGKRGKSVPLHRFIVDAQPGQIVDHRDGDTLNDRRLNLRVCHNTQNIRNQRAHINKRTSKLKGVYFERDRGLFRAQIMVNRRKINLGSFVDEISAAKAYDRAALQYFGEFARCNFPIGEALP